ncbi:MAG: diguanylate cyclase [Clostridiales bacterium]|nr:diguanylate cyclase [Clostridiales bacterium]
MNNELLGRYVNDANIIVLVLDEDSKVQFINNKGKEILKLKEDIIGVNWVEKFVPQDVDSWVSDVFNLNFDNKYGVDQYFESEIIGGDGSLLNVAWNCNDLNSDESIKGKLFIGTDITDKKEMESALKLYSSTDDLTQVFNNRTGNEILSKNFFYAKRRKKDLSLGIVELINFNKINDEFGFFEGDQTIKILSNIISEDVRNEDTIIRNFSNQFTIVFPDCNLENAEMIMSRIKERVLKFNNETQLDYFVEIKYSIANIFENNFETVDSMVFYLKNKL